MAIITLQNTDSSGIDNIVATYSAPEKQQQLNTALMKQYGHDLSEFGDEGKEREAEGAGHGRGRLFGMCDTHPVPETTGGGPEQRAVAMWALQDWMLAGWLQQRFRDRGVASGNGSGLFSLTVFSN